MCSLGPANFKLRARDAGDVEVRSADKGGRSKKKNKMQGEGGSSDKAKWC